MTFYVTFCLVFLVIIRQSKEYDNEENERLFEKLAINGHINDYTYTLCLGSSGHFGNKYKGTR